MELIDISVPLGIDTIAWKDRGPVAEQTVIRKGDGERSRESEWRLYSHAGTHLDAPNHFLPGGGDVESIPLACCIGPCRVIDVSGSGEIAPQLLPPDLEPGARLLLRTENSRRGLMRARRFDETFVRLGPAAAQQLADVGVSLVGIDYLSVGGTDAHRALLERGVVVLEGIDLSRVAPGNYELICLPLRLSGGEASPVRAVLRRTAQDKSRPRD